MPVPPDRFYVYILSNKWLKLYVGVTNNLTVRVGQHRAGTGGVYTAHYQIDRLVHVEEFASIQQAIEREKQLKGWRREKKIELIETDNPTWADLYTEE
jgi:putative endonuclease